VQLGAGASKVIVLRKEIPLEKARAGELFRGAGLPVTHQTLYSLASEKDYIHQQGPTLFASQASTLNLPAPAVTIRRKMKQKR
jgi:hypothetical protein